MGWNFIEYKIRISIRLKLLMVFWISIWRHKGRMMLKLWRRLYFRRIRWMWGWVVMSWKCRLCWGWKGWRGGDGRGMGNVMVGNIVLISKIILSTINTITTINTTPTTTTKQQQPSHHHKKQSQLSPITNTTTTTLL